MYSTRRDQTSLTTSFGIDDEFTASPASTTTSTFESVTFAIPAVPVSPPNSSRPGENPVSYSSPTIDSTSTTRRDQTSLSTSFGIDDEFSASPASTTTSTFESVTFSMPAVPVSPPNSSRPGENSASYSSSTMYSTRRDQTSLSTS